MNIEEFISLYGNKSDQWQAKFLSRLGHQLTIFARDTYAVDSDLVANPALIRGINEIMHKIFGQQFNLLIGDVNRYPDEVLIEMIFEMAAEYQFEHTLWIGITDSLKTCADID